MFFCETDYLLELGSTEEYWKRQDAARVVALVSFTLLLVALLVRNVDTRKSYICNFS